MDLVLELVGRERLWVSGMRCGGRSSVEEHTVAVLAGPAELGMSAGSPVERIRLVVVGSGRLAVEGMLLVIARKEERIDAAAAMERCLEELETRRLAASRSWSCEAEPRTTMETKQKVSAYEDSSQT